MAVVTELDQHYIDNKLACPKGKKRYEVVDPQGSGLYILVNAATPGLGTFIVRFKDSTRTTKHKKLGRTNEMTLEQARQATAEFKLTLRTPASAPQAAESVTPNPTPSPGAENGAATAEGMTLHQFWKDHYLPHAKVNKRSAWRDEQIYRRIKPKFGHLLLSQITRLAVQQFQNNMLATEKLAKATVNQHAVLLRRMLNLAVSWEMLGKNVLTRIPLFHLDNQVEHFLDDEQVDNLVHVLKTDDNRLVCLIVMFLLSTGARRAEALKAEWKQVDQAKKVWRIPATNSKSKKMKSLPLNDSAMWVIEQLESQGNSDFLFPSPATGKPYLEITRVWYRLRDKAGLPKKTRLHDLRHTFASRLVSAGTSLYVVQHLLGHADPRMTQRYAHLSMETMQAASNSAALAVV